MKQYLLIAFILIIKTGFSQNNLGPAIGSSNASVIIHKDPRIDALVKKQASINLTIKKASGYTTHGYRLLIMNTNNRDEAINAKTKIYTYFPELKSYLLYQAPFFKLKAGNFTNHEDAEKYRRNMNKLFPRGVFIVDDVIEIKPEKEDLVE